MSQWTFCGFYCAPITVKIIKVSSNEKEKTDHSPSVGCQILTRAHAHADTDTQGTHTHTHVHLHRVTLSGKFEQATQRSPICLGDIYNLFESFCLLAQVTDVGTKAFDCGKHAPASAHVQLLQKRDCKNYLIKKSDGGIILEL